MNEMPRRGSERFVGQLGFWSLNGSVCAAPSFLIAFPEGYSIPAMLSGVAGLVVVYALVTSSQWHRAGIGRSRFGRILRGAVVGRSVIAAAAVVAWLGVPALQLLVGWAMIFDLYPGMVSTGLTQLVWPGDLGHDSATAFAPTLFTTVLQGLLVSLEFVLLALVVTGGGWLWRKAQTRGRS